MTGVRAWTGRETRLLRLARRMSVREFANHLGVSDRMVSKWEAGGRTVRPREFNQATLDESLRRCSDNERQRFDQALRDTVTAEPDATTVRLQLVVDVPADDVGTAAAVAAAIKALSKYGP